MAMVDPLRLAEIVARLPGGGKLHGANPLISGVKHDSRSVVPGDLFVAIPGAVVDGHDYVDRAVAAGAAAVIVERDVGAPNLVVVEDGRGGVARGGGGVCAKPPERVCVVGVTGRSGKT